ncbi:hypothetical protein D3C81_1600740 [compost metagenome]
MTAVVVIGIAPASCNLARVTCVDSGLISPEASITAKTSYPSAIAEIDGKATQTLVNTPAITNFFFPVFFTASTNAGVSHALTSPLRPTYTACGAFSWISGINGPLGPFGSDAVVITGIFSTVAI